MLKPRISSSATAIVLVFLVSGLPVPGQEQEKPAQEQAATEETPKPPAAEQPPEDQKPLDELTAEAQAVLDDLRASLPEDSEARVMLEDIVKGSQLGPTDGWFRVALSQSRYNWPAVVAAYDRNQDGMIRREEFPGPDDAFRRLDRDGDQTLREKDLEWKSPRSGRPAGAMFFQDADGDGNGKLTRDEFLKIFQELDTEGLGYVALDDFRNRFPAPPEGASSQPPDSPSRSTLILGLARQEIGSLQPGPSLDEPAPDFTLSSLDGQPVTLSQEIGAQPVVLIFGNFTCGPFRSQSGNLEKLYLRYRDRARFLLVYVREAHPSDGWWMQSNRRVGIEFSQPQTDAERCDVAGRCQKLLDLNLPLVVDSVADTVGATYSGMPNRLYLLDREGRVAFKSGRGPFGFRPAELEQALILLLAEQLAASGK